MSAWIIYALIWWMDNHLWEHEDVAGAKLIVYVWDLCEACVCVCVWKVMLVNWYALLDVGCVVWTSVMDYCNRVLCILYAFLHFKSSISALWRAAWNFLLKSQITFAETQGHTMRTHTDTPFGVWRCIRSPWNHLNVVHFILVQRRPLSSSPYFLFRRPPWHGKCQALLAGAFWLLQTFVKC